MSRWLIRVLFVLAVGSVIGSAIWNNIATNRLIEQATGENRAQQVAALGALVQRDDFFDLLQSRKTPARLRVADGVEAMNNADGVKIALAMLRDPDPRVRDRFLESLKKLGADNLAAVADGLKNGDAKVRNGTVQVMIALGEASIPHALKAFEDSSGRGAATEVLAYFGAKSVPGLLELLRTKEDEGLRLDVIAALGRIGDRRATDAILPFLNLPPEKRRVVLCRAGQYRRPAHGKRADTGVALRAGRPRRAGASCAGAGRDWNAERAARPAGRARRVEPDGRRLRRAGAAACRREGVAVPRTGGAFREPRCAKARDGRPKRDCRPAERRAAGAAAERPRARSARAPPPTRWGR
jgi:HEAT repeat protein